MANSTTSEIRNATYWKNIFTTEREQYLRSDDPAEQDRLIDSMATKALDYIRRHPTYNYADVIPGGFMGRGEQATLLFELGQLVVGRVTRALIKEKLFDHQYTEKLIPVDWADDTVGGLGREIELYLESDDDQERAQLLDLMVEKVLAYLRVFPDATDGIAGSLSGAFIRNAGKAKEELYRKLVEEVKRKLTEKKGGSDQGTDSASDDQVQSTGRRRHRLRDLLPWRRGRQS